MKRLFISLLLTLCLAAAVSAQEHYRPHISIGGKAGATISKVSFSPGVKQSMLPGVMGGITFRYAEERHFGLIAELVFEQRGWKENFEDAPYSYTRTLNYLQLPLLTHITFGSSKFKVFFNLGPEFSYLIGSSTEADFDFHDTSIIDGLIAGSRVTDQLAMEISNKFDYGISAGAGMEYVIKKRHSLMLEARFYYGLGNMFPSSKRDVFAASRGMSVMVSLAYSYRIK